MLNFYVYLFKKNKLALKTKKNEKEINLLITNNL